MGIDLTGLGRKVLKQEAKAVVPEIVGVVVFEQTDATLSTAVSDVLKAEGFAIDTVIKNDDGTLLFKQADFVEDESVLVRLSENMAVVVKGFEGVSEVLSQAADFSEIMPAEGFFHGVRTAQEALSTGMQSVLRKSESPAVASSAIKAMTLKFNDYMTALTEGLPANAFKADMLLEEVLKGSKDSAVAAAMAKDAKDGDKADDKKDDAKKEGEVEVSTAAVAAVVDAPVVEAVAAVAAVAEVAAKAEVPDIAALIGAAIKAELAPFAEKQNKLAEQVEEIARKADDASKAVKTTVLASAKEDPAPKSAAKKSDNDPRTGCFDSATFRRNK